MEKPKNKMQIVIESGIDGVHDARNVPAKLARMMLFKMNIGWNQWEFLIDKYVSTENAKFADSVKKKSSLKGNESKKLQDDRLSWKALINAFHIAGLVKFDISITGHIGHLSHTVTIKDIIISDEKENNSKFPDEEE